MVMMMFMIVVVMMMLMIVMMMVLMIMVVVMFVEMMVVHRNEPSFLLFVVLYRQRGRLSKHLFLREYPRGGLAPMGETMYNSETKMKEAAAMSELHEHTLNHLHVHANGMAHSHGHVHENQKAVVNRLARAIGHLEKVKRMVEEGHDCTEVLVQLAAVRSALDNTGKVILNDHLRHCVVDAVATGDADAVDDLCQAIDKFMK